MAFFPSNFMLQGPPPPPPPPPPQQPSSHEDHDHHPPTNLSQLMPTCNPQDFHGVASFLGKRSMSFSGLELCEEMNGEDDLSDDCSQTGEKKKRLNMEQVKTLERNFELGNKLEPERKMQLARALGLQPRQIAIWFQNRRARWKTKQLEKDYDLLKKQYEAVKADNDLLQAQNKKLQSEIMVLKKSRETEPINLNKETEGSCSIKSENSSDLNLDISKAAVDSPITSHALRPVYPPIRPANVVQFLQGPSRSDLSSQKFMAGAGAAAADENAVQEEPFCNMFCTMDDHSGFWPWTDHSPHSFH
ncbi:unnamed protein product [Victoria cruziana]